MQTDYVPDVKRAGKGGDVLRGKTKQKIWLKISPGLARHAERVLELRPSLAL